MCGLLGGREGWRCEISYFYKGCMDWVSCCRQRVHVYKSIKSTVGYIIYCYTVLCISVLMCWLRASPYYRSWISLFWLFTYMDLISMYIMYYYTVPGISVTRPMRWLNVSAYYSSWISLFGLFTYMKLSSMYRAVVCGLRPRDPKWVGVFLYGPKHVVVIYVNKYLTYQI
jgi:hypothetical protein